MTLPIEECDYFPVVMPFGVSIPAFIRLNSDGTYTLYLNSDYDFSHWLNSYEHEIMHMANDDIYSDKPIEELEPQLRYTG